MVVRRTVLVTRPEPGATETAGRLTALGFEPLVMPMTRIVPLDPPPPTNDCDAVAVTSPNALRRAPPRLLRHIAGKPLFAVGEATAAAARDRGFAVEHADGTAAGLAGLIAHRLQAGSRILYLAGTVRTDGFEHALARHGLAVETVEIYDAPEIEHGKRDLASLRAAPPFAALVYSRRAGDLLAVLAASDLVPGAFDDTVFLCISRKAASPLERIAAGRIEVSAEPTEEALLRLLGPRS
jgi:uroporphyrinogen-III synthase